jgi:hypothetical protein
MVRLYFQCGHVRRCIDVPLKEARRVNKTLFDNGAAVYWTERLD